MRMGSVKSPSHDIVVEPQTGPEGSEDSPKISCRGCLHDETAQEIADHQLAIPMHPGDFVGRADGQIGLCLAVCHGPCRKLIERAHDLAGLHVGDLPEQSFMVKPSARKLLAGLPLFVCPLAAVSFFTQAAAVSGRSIPVNTSDELVRISGQL